MFLLFGLKTVLKELPGRPASCQYCHTFAHHHLEERATRFTVFFIPLLTVSRSYRITCSNCGRMSSISAGQKKVMAGR
jgi:zinc-ribbon family